MKRIPLNPQQPVELGTVEEVAAAAVFLASDEASFVNGHPLALDGGALAG